MSKTPLLGFSQAYLQTLASELGLPAFVGKQLALWIYQKGATSFDEMTNLSKAARERLNENYEVGQMPPVTTSVSADGTIKYLFPTHDGHTVETVFIPEEDRATLCVSCQVGCKMNCQFCATGKQGFQGQLSVTDILNQIYAVPQRDELTNIVFMGQGEPMDNLDAILEVTELLQAPYGWAWSPKRITVSTVGLKKGLRRFLDESRCHLAVSLHNPFPEGRAAMMPAERSFSLTEMLELLKEYDWHGQRRLSFEYIMFGQQNDTNRHARELVRLLGPLECRVNLIRWHAIPGQDTLSEADPQRMVAFRDYLNAHGLRCTIRTSRGQDIQAACGLLKTSQNA